MNGLLLDTHVALWLAGDPERLSPDAAAAVASADELLLASPSWYELAWLHRAGRVRSRTPLRAWLDVVAVGLRTLPMTPAVAARAVSLPDTFPKDPFDRMIFATAVEHGLNLVTGDGAMRRHDVGRRVVVW